MNAMDQIMDENNAENIVMYGENGEPMEFQQIAVIPIEENVFVILRPVGDVKGIGEDEALVFVIEEFEGEEGIRIVEDERVIDLVFEEYYKLLREAGVEV